MSRPKTVTRAHRLEQIRAFLHASPEGISAYDIQERFGGSLQNARRDYRTLRDMEEHAVYEETIDKRRVLKVKERSRRHALTLTTAELMSVYAALRLCEALEGTGIKQELDDVYKKLKAALRSPDHDLTHRLDRMFFYVNEGPRDYSDREEDVDDIRTAIRYGQRLRVRHGSVEKYNQRFFIDPFTLLFFRGGTYLIGYSHVHYEIRMFTLDGFKEIQRRKKDTFEYPEPEVYDPETYLKERFGLFGGKLVEYRIRFHDADAARNAYRRKRPHQTFERNGDGTGDLTMRVRGEPEVLAWVLSYGEKAELVGPAGLRAKIARRLQQAASRYERDERSSTS